MREINIKSIPCLQFEFKNFFGPNKNLLSNSLKKDPFLIKLTHSDTEVKM